MMNTFVITKQYQTQDKKGVVDKWKLCGPTDGTEGMAELQVECINGHIITHRQDSHRGEVAGRVGDISTGCHRGQTQGWAWKKERQKVC